MVTSATGGGSGVGLCIMAAMDNRSLTGERLDRLRKAELTYAEVGRTRGELPDAYRQISRQASIGNGVDRFNEASRILLGWGMHRRAGLKVATSNDVATVGTVAVLRLGVGRAAVDAPVRVAYVVDEPTRRGFAYGTLPGHPETGEEAFVVELRDDGTVTFTITAFSRPSSRLARAAGPVSGLVQRWVTTRYLRSLHSIGVPDA